MLCRRTSQGSSLGSGQYNNLWAFPCGMRTIYYTETQALQMLAGIAEQYIYMLWRYATALLASGAATLSQVLRGNYWQCTGGQGLCMGQGKKQQGLRGQGTIA
jgi:hypothetical protein